MKPTVNTLIQSVIGDSQIIVERVLYIDPSGENVAIINVDITCADPTWRLYKDITISLETNEARILEIDHHSPFAFSESELASKKFHQVKSRGEMDWYIIKPLISGENAVRMLFPLERKVLIRNRYQQLREERIITGISPKSILRKVRRYWQRGQMQHALFPDYVKSGGKGKPRKAGRRSEELLARYRRLKTGLQVLT